MKNNWYTRLRAQVLKAVAVITAGSGERAKDSRGRFVADDKSTPNVNEAYKDGKKPPKKKTRGKKGRNHAGVMGGKKPKGKGRGRPKGSKNKKK